AEEAKASRVPRVDISQHLAELPRRLAVLGPEARDGDGVRGEVGHVERFRDASAIRVRIGPHASFARGDKRGELWDKTTSYIEQFVGSVAHHPPLKHCEVLAVRADAVKRDLVGAKRPLDRHTIDLART